MKKIFTLTAATIALALLSATGGYAQQGAKTEFSVGADLVSSYVWRGVYQSGASVQPGIGLEYCGFSAGAWGSTVLDGSGFKELDLSLGYSVAGFSVGVTDYFWAGEGISFFDRYLDTHLIEATVVYSFGEKLDVPIYISWSTFLAGDLDKGRDGKRKYSSYVEAGYEFAIGSVDMSASVGMAPWDSPAWLAAPWEDRDFKSGFQVSAITLGAAKALRISDTYSMSIFANLIASPACDNAHLVMGLAF